MATKKSQQIRKFPKQGTIGHIVLTSLANSPDVKLEDLTKKVLKKFPESKFNAAHLAWYKHQVKQGNYVLPIGDAEDKNALAAEKKAKRARKPKAKKQETVEAAAGTPEAPAAETSQQ